MDRAMRQCHLVSQPSSGTSLTLQPRCPLKVKTVWTHVGWALCEVDLDLES